jgi:hypothetical protein
MLLQLTYVSTPRAPFSARDIAALLSAARTANARRGVTGLLLYDGVRFLQVLEGEPVAVDAVLERIRTDPRHHALVVLSRRTIEGRRFSDWAMAYRDARDDRDLATVVAPLVEGADANTRALFESFARLKRAA